MVSDLTQLNHELRQLRKAMKDRLFNLNIARRMYEVAQEDYAEAAAAFHTADEKLALQTKLTIVTGKPKPIGKSRGVISNMSKEQVLAMIELLKESINER